MRIYIPVMIAIAMFAAACGGIGSNQRSESSPPSPRADAAATQTPQPVGTPAGAEAVNAPNALGSKEARERCYETDTGDYVVQKSQTFAIDFEPFKGSCFVTSHNPEFDDPPLETEFAIYSKGERVFDFPSQFNGVTTGCWVEGVGFQDANADDLTDVIVVGNCSAKTAPYNENMVYINTGRAFVTNEDANVHASAFATVKAVVDHAKENREMFRK